MSRRMSGSAAAAMTAPTSRSPTRLRRGKSVWRTPDRNAEQQIEEREFQQVVDEQLQRLSQIERTILILYHQEERSYEQISSTLGNADRHGAHSPSPRTQKASRSHPCRIKPVRGERTCQTN